MDKGVIKWQVYWYQLPNDVLQQLSTSMCHSSAMLCAPQKTWTLQMSESNAVENNGGRLQDFTIDQAAGAIALSLFALGSLVLVIWQSRCLCRCRIGISLHPAHQYLPSDQQPTFSFVRCVFGGSRCVFGGSRGGGGSGGSLDNSSKISCATTLHYTSWEGCSVQYAVPYPRPHALDVDYGTPTEFCREASPGVFTREWTKATVTLDYNSFEANISMKQPGTKML
jgi:hypothetical protein